MTTRSHAEGRRGHSGRRSGKVEDMISASIAETHRFGRVRKNGYDPAEVDAVIARLVDALRRNDERITTLSDKIDEADASADAIRKTFVAAQTTHDEIIEDARSEASTIAEVARHEAEDLAAAAEGLHLDVATSRDEILSGVYKEAENRMREIEANAAQRSIDAEWAVKEATEVRDRAVADTEADAATASRTADLEAARIRSKIASMSRAAIGLEQAAEALANSVRESAKVIDLKAMEQLDASRIPDPKPEAVEDPEIIVESTPILTIAETTEDMDSDADGPRTRYQRSTGVPLKERIKIARMSG
jgi:DivIVA domain-containing protein